MNCKCIKNVIIILFIEQHKNVIQVLKEKIDTG